MKKLIAIGLVLGLLVLATISCSASRPTTTTAPATTSVPGSMGQYYTDERGYEGNAPAPTLAPAPTTARPPLYDGEDSSGTSTSLPAERRVVRTGNIELVVSDVAASLDNITKLAADFGGYVVTSQKWKEGERNIGTISIRVLAENYDKAIVGLRAMAMSIISESTSSQDVTEEYTDLDSRVKNLEATEAQLLKIMESATKTEDILSIQREITNVRGEIEQAKGRMQYLQRTSSTSLIQVKLKEAVLDLKFTAGQVRADVDESILFTAEVAGGFTPYSYLWDFGDGSTSVEKSPSHAFKNSGVYTVQLSVTDDKGYKNSIIRSEYINVTGTWNPGSIARSAWNGFSAFGRVLVNILIWLGIFSPVWIIIGAIVWWRVYRKKKKAKGTDAKNNTPAV
jgi:PKD repeat protein